MDARSAWELFERETGAGRRYRKLTVVLTDDNLDTPDVIQDQADMLVDHYYVYVPSILPNLFAFLSALYAKRAAENDSRPVYIDFLCDNIIKQSWMLSILGKMHRTPVKANIYGRLADMNGVVYAYESDVSYDAPPLASDEVSFWVQIASPCGLDLVIHGVTMPIQPSWHDALQYYQDLYHSSIEYRHLCQLKYSDKRVYTEYLLLARDQLFCALLRLDGWNTVKIQDARNYIGPTVCMRECTSIGLMWVTINDPPQYPKHSEFVEFIQACTETVPTPVELDKPKMVGLEDIEKTGLTDNKRQRQDVDSQMALLVGSSSHGMYSGRRATRARAIRICLQNIPSRQAEILLAGTTKRVERVDVSLIEIVRRSYVHRFDLEYEMYPYMITREPFDRKEQTPDELTCVNIGKAVESIFKTITDKFDTLPVQEFNFKSNCLAMSYTEARRYKMYLEWKDSIGPIESFDYLGQSERIMVVRQAYVEMAEYFQKITWDTGVQPFPDSSYTDFVIHLNDAVHAAYTALDNNPGYANDDNSVIGTDYNIDLLTLLDIGYYILVHSNTIAAQFLNRNYIRQISARRYPDPDGRYRRHLAYAKLRERELLAHVLSHNVWHIREVTHIINECLGYNISDMLAKEATSGTIPEWSIIPRYLRDENILQSVDALDIADLNIRKYIVGLSLNLDRPEQITLTVSAVKHVFVAVSHTVQVLWPYGVPPVWKNTILDTIWVDLLANNESASLRKIQWALEKLNKANEITEYYNEISLVRYFVVLMFVLHTDLIGKMNERQITMISTLFSQSNRNTRTVANRLSANVPRRTRVIKNSSYLW